MATSGEKRWPPVGNFVAASGEKPMAIDKCTGEDLALLARALHPACERTLRSSRGNPPMRGR